MIDILVWGIGQQYNIIKNTLNYYEMTNQIHITALAASDAYMTKLDGYDVIKPSNISKYKWDYIFVMSENSFNSIVEDAVSKYGVSRNKLISYRVLQIPELNLNKYISLKESGLSIISNNCWGGIIYRTLGMECLSPFKNLFVRDEDYLKIISNFENYMRLNPEFCRYEVDSHSKERYPVLSLGDVEIHCNHDTDPDIAASNWIRRREKINFDNLFFEMYTQNKETAEKFAAAAEKFKSVCFVPANLSDVKDTVSLELAPSQKEFYEAVNANASIGAYGLKYDLVDLLMGERRFRY